MLISNGLLITAIGVLQCVTIAYISLHPDLLRWERR